MELIREERRRQEAIVRKKWDSFIADDEQTLLVLDRDRKAFLTTQQATNEKSDAELASLQDVLRKETAKEEETQQQLKEATEANQAVVDRLQKARAEKQSVQSTLAEKQLQLQQLKSKLVVTKARENNSTFKLLCAALFSPLGTAKGRAQQSVGLNL